MQPTLTIHLNQIVENYQRLARQFTGSKTAAVVKADAYGLGAAEISAALARAGCDLFFVATLEEGAALRRALPTAQIAVFSGPYAGEEAAYIEHDLLPVINHIPQLERWMLVTKRHAAAEYMLHVDTGMTRLGLSISDVEWLHTHGQNLLDKQPLTLMSHLACASEPEHPKNAEQLKRFKEASNYFRNVPTSLCNSSGIFLGAEFHGDLARPGCALYGITPNPSKPNPMLNVADLHAPILMIRTLDRDETVGYGATKPMRKGSRIAIVQIGYADGLLRYLSNSVQAFIGDTPCAVLGRVSMDMIAVDVSYIPDNSLHSGLMVELLGGHQTVDQLAEAANTIGYEIFTRIGARVKRVYK